MPLFLHILFSYLILFFGSIDGIEQESSLSPVTVEVFTEEETIQKERPFLIASYFNLTEGWHIYWKNPGETGASPLIEWELPSNLKVENTLWQTPSRFESMGTEGYGYDKSPTLFSVFKMDGLNQEEVSVKGTIRWLACSSTECRPGSKTVELTLKVSEETPKKNEAHLTFFEREKAKLPLTSGVIKAKADYETIHVELAAKETEETPYSKAFFFSEDGELIESKSHVDLARQGNSYLVSLKASKEKKAGLLKGVVLLSNETDDQTIAFEVSAPIEVDTKGIALANPPSHSSNTPGSTPHFEGGLGLALLFAFIGGILLNLMPCVLPVISFKVMSFVKMAGQDRKLTIKHGLFFCLGVLVSFWALASFMLILRSYGQTVGWGFQLQDPHFVLFLASILFLFGLSLFGVFELGLFVASFAGQKENETKSSKTGLVSSFLSGVLATAVATPCTGPFLGSAVGFAVTLPFLQAILIFTSLALGMCAPYLILASYPSLLRFLPKPGPWMETFKQLMGFLLMATVLWLLWVFSAQTNTFALIGVLAGFLCFSIAAWIYGRGSLPLVSKLKKWLAYLTAFSLLIVGVEVMLYPKSSWESAEPSSTSKGNWEGWEEFSPDLIAKLTAENTPFIIDFTAKWCLVCQANHLVLASEEMQKAFDDKGIVKIKADWTKNDPEITKALSSYGRSSVPLYVMHGGNPEKEPLILPQILTKDLIFEHIEQATSSLEIASQD